ncbi:MAG TPA: flagellar biosynthetic protein FliR [Steroidobacteraceae bacterium]|nr:flagellar biosynthetic protein FliR [Steroidobacteraceae bacterium]
MLHFTTTELQGWLALYLWPFIRIGACLMVAPIFGAKFVPPRTRVILAASITLLVAPLLPPPPPGLVVFSLPGFVVAIQQVLIGAATGFVLQVAFDALAMGGQLLSNGMGLSFAFNVDPLRGTSTPVLGQLYMIIVTLTFLALGGHHVLLQVLVEGFRQLPVGVAPPASTWYSIAAWGSQLFAGSLVVALPGMTAMLVANLAIGVMSRAAPTLNLFAVGFPLTLAFGLVIVWLGLPAVQTGFIGLMEAAFAMLRTLGTAPGGG